MKTLLNYIKESLNVDKNTKEAIIFCLQRGYITNPEDGKNYVCSVDNVITKFFNPEDTGITDDVLQSILKDMNKSGKTPKYNTENDAKKEISDGTLLIYKTKDYIDNKTTNVALLQKQNKKAPHVNKTDVDTIKYCLKRGYVYDDETNKKYVCAVDNVVTDIFDKSITGVDDKELQKIIKDMEAKGDYPKYLKVSDADNEIKSGKLFKWQSNIFVGNSK